MKQLKKSTTTPSLLTKTTALALLLAGSGAALAEERFEIEGYVNFVSDYRFRSISLSDRKPSLQGSLSLIDNSGVYLGVWGAAVQPGGTELDAYIGYAQRFISGMEVDVGYSLFEYTGDEVEEFQEVHGRIGYSAEWFGSISLRYAWSDDFRNNSGNGHYYSLDFSKENRINQSTSAGFRAGTGYQRIEDNQAFGLDDYLEWQVGAWVDWKDTRLGVDYVANDLSESDCPDMSCATAVVFSIGKGL